MFPMLILLLAVLLPSLALSVPAPLNRSTGCTNGMITSSEGTMCYKIINAREDYQTARQFCSWVGIVFKNVGANAASIHSTADNELTRKKMAHMYWLGASFVDGKWTWDDLSDFDYSNWVAGGPNPSKGHCIAVDHITGLWTSRDCTDKLSAMCEMKPKVHEL